MTIALSPALTLEEFLNLPETKPASEFIEGRIYQKPMPQGKHSRLQFKLCETVNQVAESPKIALAFPELRCTFGNRSIIPDVAVFSWERIPFDGDREIENVFNMPPDWAIEILSPDQNATKVIGNLLHCLNHGTKLGWFVDPGDRIILAFLPGQQPIELRGFQALPMLQSVVLELTAEQVFGWLRAGG
ncbi:MAG: Uma2 family endonuclease [Timaviella obliquedivisa GSE-PSE-MK23-08B]|jgi:Uma2 family endonuclease|nr:Uma2 family endonuclease [Timaviella obliquedivisa GSE-PSE-MK23-08B]